MNTLHKDINKIIPFGEFLRGFINQRYITASDLARILRERGIFVLNHEKDIMVPVMQNLLLSPTELWKKKIMRKNFLGKSHGIIMRKYLFQNFYQCHWMIL